MRSTLGLCVLSVLLGCGATDEPAEVAVAAKAMPLAQHECATCSMTVAEQPAPRGQLGYRDGTQLYFCSVGDMLAHLQAPSRRGRATGVFVETLGAGEDPGQHDLKAHPWAPAASAHYVVGAERAGIMGPPVLVYADHAQAAQAAAAHGGKAVGYDELRRWFQTQQP